MINQEEIANEQFIKALKHHSDKLGYGGKTAIAVGSGLTLGYISQLLKPGSKKRADTSAQEAIARACGHDDLVSFLRLGKSLLVCELKPGMKRIGGRVGLKWSDEPDTHEKSSGIDQNSNIDAKVGNGMEAIEKDAILRHCLEELAALREEIKYLREERNHFRDRIMEIERQKSEPEEKKTAV